MTRTHRAGFLCAPLAILAARVLAQDDYIQCQWSFVGCQVAQFREVLEDAVMLPLEGDLKAELPKFNPVKFLEDVIDTYVGYLDQNPAFRALALGQLISAGKRAREATPISGLHSVLRSFLLERMRMPSSPELDLTLRVVSEAGERLIAFAYEQALRSG